MTQLLRHALGQTPPQQATPDRDVLLRRVLRDSPVYRPSRLSQSFEPSSIEALLADIPPTTLQYALAYHASLDIIELEDIPPLFEQLREDVAHGKQDETFWLQRLQTLSDVDRGMMRDTFEAVQWLTADFAKDTIQLSNKYLHLTHPIELSKLEEFRIQRAFYRYAIMCSLPHHEPQWNEDDNDVEDETEEVKELKKLQFALFSPWVNEQLRCVYVYLKRKIGRAYKHMALYDVEWGEMPISWPMNGPSGFTFHALMNRDPIGLQKVCAPQTHEERRACMNINSMKYVYEGAPADKMSELAYLGLPGFMAPYGDTTVSLVPDVTMMKLRSHYHFEVGGLVGGSELDTAFAAWFAAHWDVKLDNLSERKSERRRLWRCGYVMFEAFESSDGRVQHSNLVEQRLTELRCPQAWYSGRDPDFEDGEENDESHDDDEAGCCITEIKRFGRMLSEYQRTDIYFANGTGYWKTYQAGSGEKADFSGVQGISATTQQELVDRWEDTRYSQDIIDTMMEVKRSVGEWRAGRCES